MTENYDNTEEGKSMIAMLERYGPPPADSVVGREAVLSQLPAGRKLSLWQWLVPATGTAAAALIAVVLLSDPSTPVSNNPVDVVNVTPAKADTEVDTAEPELGLEVRMIRPIEDGWLLDRGLSQGLRIGDELVAGGVKIRVTSTGIFRSRGQVLEGKPSRGENLRSSSLSPAMKRAADLRNFGGDAGGFYVFGAGLEILSVDEAREHGIEHGTAIRVRETFPAIYQPDTGKLDVTLAARLGLQVGDVLLQIDGKPVPDFAAFTQALGWQSDKSLLMARVLRNGSPLDLRLR
ncbi:MAG: hypothetical protein ACYTDT_05950 [Planctomycetota bacterium]|jgi:membrane-associated protease RseP (regulator of RpoE activity)